MHRIFPTPPPTPQLESLKITVASQLVSYKIALIFWFKQLYFANPSPPMQKAMDKSLQDRKKNRASKKLARNAMEWNAVQCHEGGGQ